MPGFVPVVPQAPSPRAEALGQRLAETIEQFRQQNPDLSGLEVQQATRLAVSRSGGTCGPPRAVLALVAGLVAAGMGLYLGLDKGSAAAAQWPVMLVLVGFVVVLAVVVALKRR
jgi:hypothetical protein